MASKQEKRPQEKACGGLPPHEGMEADALRSSQHCGHLAVLLWDLFQKSDLRSAGAEIYVVKKKKKKVQRKRIETTAT